MYKALSQYGQVLQLKASFFRLLTSQLHDLKAYIRTDLDPVIYSK